jgi:hypothetical protein
MERMKQERPRGLLPDCLARRDLCPVGGKRHEDRARLRF